MTPEDLEALDRLEQKVRLLVTEMGRLRADQATTAEENRRLSDELHSALAKLADAEGAAAAEMATMRQERDQVRSRVAGILEHLEGLDI
jgi:regulator of replication initiation timing